MWGHPCDRVPLEFLILRVVHNEPAAIHQFQFRFSLPGSSHGSFHSWISVLLSCVFLYWSVWISHLWLSCLSCIPSPRPLIDPRSGVGFSVCSDYYLLLGWWGDVQAPYMLNQNPELVYFFYSITNNAPYNVSIIWLELCPSSDHSCSC